MSAITYVCPRCHGCLAPAEQGLQCADCAESFPVEGRIADFSGGRYFDRFVPGQELTAAERAGLINEVPGIQSRIRDYYAPRVAAGKPSEGLRVLDSGCGNGLSVDLLREAGFDAWGIDLSALRKWQWLERAAPERLACADSLQLPFADGTFDVVLCSGVLEHVGVEESGGARYTVRPRPDRDAQRLRFLREHVRVLAAGGSLFLDFPNGAFPIDFWHGLRPGAPRWHRRSEGFLPTADEVRGYAEELPGQWDVVALTPQGRLRFHQVGRHWWGRILAPAAALYLRLLARPMLDTAANPFLVLRLRRRIAL